MTHVNPVFLALAAMLNGIATAILNANHVFDGRSWIAWCLYGATIILLAWAAVNAVSGTKREEKTPAPPPAQQIIHQESKQEFNPQLYIGTEDHASISAKKEQDGQDRLVLDFLKKSEYRFYLVAEIAEAVNISKPDARATLERLEAQKRLWKVPVQAPGGYAWQLDDLERE